MLNYKNDSLLLDKETVNDLIRDKKDHLIFLDKENKILNLFSAFVKKNDFIKKNKRTLPLQRVPYITGKKTSKKINKLIEKLPKEYIENDHQKIRLIIKEYVNRSTRIRINDYKRWFNYKRFPLPFIRILARIKSKTTKIKEESILVELLKDCKLVGCHGQGNFSPKLVLDKLLTEKHAYLIGCIYGDGCLAKNNYMSIVDGSSNEENIKYSEEFLKNIKELTGKLYPGLNIKITKEKNKCILHISNKWFCRYINFFFGIPIGYKKNKLTYPRILSLSKNKELEKIFWRGMFDTDGYQYKDCRNAGLSSHSKEIINNCSKFLQKYNIKAPIINLERGYSLHINYINFLKFSSIIGFAHPRKQKDLKYWIKKEHKQNIMFSGINKQNMHYDFFDLSLLPLRVYNSNSLIRQYKKNLSNKELSGILRVSKSTISGWINGKFGIPIQRLIELAEIQGYSKLEVYNELYKFRENIKFCLIKGKGKGSAVKLPLKINKDLLHLSQHIRTSFPKLHIRNKINGNTIKKDKTIKLVKKVFETKVRLQKNQIYRIDSATLSRFFETFFNYKYAWEIPNNDKVNKLIRKMNNIWN